MISVAASESGSYSTWIFCEMAALELVRAVSVEKRGTPPSPPCRRPFLVAAAGADAVTV